MTGTAQGVFLMTDIVASTRLWAAHTTEMSSDLAVHDEVMRGAIGSNGGEVISTAGDSFAAAFADVGDAADAATAAQQAIAATPWQVPDGIEVRMGVHLGEAQRRGGGWYGPPLNEAARIMAAAHGGQVVVSAAVAGQLRTVELLDLGEHRLRDLDGPRHLFQVVVPGQPDGFPSLRSMGTFTTTLPGHRTALLGREDFVGKVRAGLADHRLVSIVGPGGAGKTRTAIEAAGRELGNFVDGVFFIDLTTASAGDQVSGAIASGTKVPLVPDVPSSSQTAAHFAGRRALLVVDNCEHVIDSAARAIDQLLAAAPEVRILTTTREPLDLPGEVRLHVPSLDIDGPQSAGVQLFSQRALAADDHLELSDADLDVIAEIAKRLDGMPLAIELAAAQMRTLAPAQILSHLDDRFRLLKRGHRGRPERQRTLAAAIDWSYDRLDDDLQQSFRRLTICAGKFELRTAAGLLAVDDIEAADILDALVSRSLVTPVVDDGRVRGYRLLESLRDYGRERLLDAEESTKARAALEAALRPLDELTSHVPSLVNDYICSSENGPIEDVTRREAASVALAAGRLDTAAFIYSSCAFREDPGDLDQVLGAIRSLARRREELEPVAWIAANAAKLLLERATRRYFECMATATFMLGALAGDDPARGWFESWRWALTTAVAPELGVAGIDEVLPAVRNWAQPPTDWALSQLLATKATGLAVTGRLGDALVVVEESLEWLIEHESRDQPLALIAWILYLTDAHPSPEIADAISVQSEGHTAAELCAAPGALAADLPVVDRGRSLARLARRRRSTDVPTPYLLAFALLALELGDTTRAAELFGVAELFDSSTMVALVFTASRLEGWTPEGWVAARDRVIGELLTPERAVAAERGVAVLTGEIERWDRMLANESQPIA